MLHVQHKHACAVRPLAAQSIFCICQRIRTATLLRSLGSSSELHMNHHNLWVHKKSVIRGLAASGIFW
jgi:hypothetical protein